MTKIEVADALAAINNRMRTEPGFHKKLIERYGPETTNELHSNFRAVGFIEKLIEIAVETRKRGGEPNLSMILFLDKGEPPGYVLFCMEHLPKLKWKLHTTHCSDGSTYVVRNLQMVPDYDPPLARVTE